MATSNEKIFDAAVRHQVNLQRMSKGEANKIVRLLDKSDKELAKLIRKRFEKLDKVDFTTKRWQALRTEIARTRSSVLRSISDDVANTMEDLATLEQDIAKQALQESVPVEINFATASPAQLRTMVQNRPFGGADTARTLLEWMTNLEDVDHSRITGALQASVAQGETIPQAMKRIEQATGMTKQNAEAVARTGINHITNASREEFFKENNDVILALRWVSTLDGRTSAICRARDGHFAPVEGGSEENIPSPKIVGSPQRPPAHLRCRSLMIAVLDSDAIADKLPDRPYVRDTRTGRQREVDFRREARQQAGEDWKHMDKAERTEAIRARRRAWAKENVGTVPGETTYDEWLRRQDPEFQDAVLGPTKAKRFREGLRMDQYVDRDGNELTIAELKKKTPPASTQSAAEREISKARDLDAQAKRAEANVIKAREREKAAAERAAAEEKRAAELRAEQAKQKKEAQQEAARRKKEREEAARKAREQKAAAAAKKRAETKKKAVEKVDRARFFKDEKYARSQSPTIQDELLGKERAEFVRRGAPLHVVTDTKGKLVPIDDLIEEYPRHIRQPGMEWTPGKQDKWGSSLTDREKAAIDMWADDASLIQNMQETRRLGTNLADEFPDEQISMFDDFEHALGRAPVYDGEVWRGLTLKPDDIKSLTRGATLTFDVDQSATILPTKAYDFAVLAPRGANKTPVLWRIRKQTNGVMIMDHAVEAEAEVVLRAGTSYRVVGVDTRGDVRIIELEEI